MAAIALSVLNKRNNPIYLREFVSDRHEPYMSEDELFGLETPADEEPLSSHEDCSVKQQFIMHAALDRFDQIINGGQWRKPGMSGTDAMFIGLLCPVEDMRVYGYITTTQVRFLLTVQDSAEQPQHVIDQNIKQLMAQIHRFYVEYTLNPFTELNGPIQSKRFDENVERCFDSFNKQNQRESSNSSS